MTITYSNGKTVEAVLLSRMGDTMRLAVQGGDDVMEFTEIHGTWVSSECEPVSIEFAWQRLDRKPRISEDDCCCSREVAARLIHSLFAGSSEGRIEMDAAIEPGRPSVQLGSYLTQ